MNRPAWLHVPLDGTWRILAAPQRGAVMSPISAERPAPSSKATITIRSTISGWHHEDGEPVVRVFLPEATDGHGSRRGGTRQRTAAHSRRRAVRRPGRRARQPLSPARAFRRRRGRDGRRLPLSADPDRPRPASARRRHASRALRQARRASDAARRRRRRRASWCSRRTRAASAWSATSISGTAAATPCGCAATAIGKFSCPARGPATNTNTRSSAATASCCR